MNCNPKIGVIFSAFAVIISVIAFLSPTAFPSYVPVGVATGIISTCAFLNIIFNAVNGVLHLYSSSAPGPLAPPDPPAVKAAIAKEEAKTAAGVVGALLIGLLAFGALALDAPRAYAAGSDEAKLTRVPANVTPAPWATPASSGAPGSTTGLPDAGPLSELADLFASDFASAAKLATDTSIKDGNGQACWTAFGPFGELVKAHPHVFSGKLATDIEAQRLTVIAARNLCNNVACSTVFTEAATAVSKVASALPVSINVNITPVNLFAKACANVPDIQVVAPTATSTPAATPTPTATPSGG